MKFGRGQDELMFVRQRPGAITLRPLVGDGLSREQLPCAPRGSTELERIGRCPTAVNGDAVDRARVRPGDTVLLSGNLLFYVVSRPRALPAVPDVAFGDVPPFGHIDRFGVIGESAGAWELRAAASRGTTVDAERYADRREDLPLLLRHLVLEIADDEPERLAAFRTDSGEIRYDGALVVQLLRETAIERGEQVEDFLHDAIAHSDGDAIRYRPEARSTPAGPRSETVPPPSRRARSFARSSSNAAVTRPRRRASSGSRTATSSIGS